MKYNIYVSTFDATYNIFNLSEEKLAIVVAAYLTGKDSFTISGKTYYLNTVTTFKIFTCERDEIACKEAVDYYMQNIHFSKRVMSNHFLPISTLEKMGKDVTDKYIGDNAFGEQAKTSTIDLNENYAEKVESLKSLLLNAATDLNIEEIHEIEYTNLRKSLLKIDQFKKLVPKFLITCSNLKEFKKEMQAVSAQYSGRRTHIKEAFYEIIETLFYTTSNEDPIAEIVQQVDFGHLNLLPVDIQEKGKAMSTVYLYLYCIENSIRIFIDEVSKKEKIKIPTKVQETIDRMKLSEQESKYLPIRGNNDLFYCDFIQLGKIIVGNWEIFKKYFPNQNEHWLNVMIEELYKIRCLVAHNSFVGDHEIQSLKVYYKNITLQLKL